MLRSDTVRALVDFAREHGACIDFRPTGSTHYRAVFSRAGRSRFIIISNSPRGPNMKRALGDARRALKELSA